MDRGVCAVRDVVPGPGRSSTAGAQQALGYWRHCPLRLVHVAACAQLISGAQKSRLCSRGHRTCGNRKSFSLPFCQFKVKRALLKRKWYLTHNCKSSGQAVLVQ